MKVNDTRPLTGRVNVDVTGGSIEVHLKKPDGVVVSKTGIVLDALTGLWSVPFAAGEVDVAGLWYVEAEVTYEDDTVQTFGPVGWRVDDEIA